MGNSNSFIYFGYPVTESASFFFFFFAMAETCLINKEHFKETN